MAQVKRKKEKNMFCIRLADVVFGIENQYNYIENLCREYCVDDTPEIVVCATEEEILAEANDETHDAGYLESLAVYRKIAEEMISRDGFLLHGVVLSVNGVGVAFLAKSGVGKSTHMSLWQSVLGEKVTVINGDKPLVRIIDGKAYAYGTPWAGKEGLQSNACVPLKKICFLERAEENSCVPLEKNDVLIKLLPQVYKPKTGAKLAATLDFVETMINGADFYQIRCNKEISAAETAISVVLESELERCLRISGVYTTKTQGDSMFPMLKTGDKVIITSSKGPYQKYDVVVYRRGDHYTMHRIVKVKKDGYIICGDNRTGFETDIKDENILGKLLGFYKGSTFFDADGKEARKYGKKATRTHFWRAIKHYFRVKCGK